MSACSKPGAQPAGGGAFRRLAFDALPGKLPRQGPVGDEVLGPVGDAAPQFLQVAHSSLHPGERDGVGNSSLRAAATHLLGSQGNARFPTRPLRHSPRPGLSEQRLVLPPTPRRARGRRDAGVAAKSAPWAMDPDAITDQAERVRNAAASFIGAAAEDIAITPSVAYGVATAAANLPLPPGFADPVGGGRVPVAILRLGRTRRSAAAPRWTSCPRPPTATGRRPCWPGSCSLACHGSRLRRLPRCIGRMAASSTYAAFRRPLRERGAAVVVDATQAAGILPVDASELGADYIVFPTYKWLLGPYTLAFLYVAPSRQGGQPLERHGSNHGGGAQPFDGALPPLVPSARRFDMGERYNPVALPMALAGMDLLRSWGRTALGARLRYLTDRLATEAEALGWTPVPAALRPPHILGLRPTHRGRTSHPSSQASRHAASTWPSGGGRMRLGGARLQRRGGRAPVRRGAPGRLEVNGPAVRVQ